MPLSTTLAAMTLSTPNVLCSISYTLASTIPSYSSITTGTVSSSDIVTFVNSTLVFLVETALDADQGLYTLTLNGAETYHSSIT
jgi:hypothetical protein